MKKILILYLFAVFFTTIKAQIFSSKIVISNNIDNPEAVCTADFNNDGYPDVAFTTVTDHKIAVCLFDPTQGNFSPQAIVSNSITYAVSLYAADLNGDGNTDLLTVSVVNNDILWFANDGTGNFTLQNPINDNAGGATYVVATDIDLDGDQDVVCAQKTDNAVVWYENDGTGNFTPHTITDQAQIPVVVITADLNNDGYQDVVAGYAQTDKVVYFLNQGDGTFSDPQILTDQTDYIFSLEAADLDGDGNIDIISASRNDNKLAWYKNLGNANFSAQIEIATDLSQAYCVEASDVDIDGDIDLICSAMGDNAIYIFKNQQAQFSRETLTDYQCAAPKGIVSADFNNDGLPDIVAALSDDNPDEVAWYKNGLPFFKTHLINKNHVITGIATCDINQDGYNDIFYSEHEGIYYVYNDNGNGFGQEHTLYSNAYNITEIKFADIDNDGDQDLFATDGMGDELMWFRNDNGTLSQKITIDNTGNGPFAMDFADVDNDGDLDLMVPFINESKLVIYENTDGNANFHKNVIIDTTTVYSAVFSDVNHDSNPDIVLTTYSYTAFLLNDGNGNFGNYTIINNNNGYAWHSISADLDNDNYQDIVFDPNYNVKWLKNNANNTYSQHEVWLPWGEYDLDTADVDNDGDIDLLTVSRYMGMYVSENINNADTFLTTIPVSIEDADEVSPAELNNDGWIDVIVGCWPSEGIYWLENYQFRIINQPVDAFACEGGQAQFSVLTTGVKTFQWQVNTGNGFTNITDNQTYEGSNKALLKITNITPDMFGYQYRCILTDKRNVQIISDTAVLYEFTPSIQCVDNQTRTADNNGIYVVNGTELDPDTVFNKCNEQLTVRNDYNNTSTLAGEQFAPGTYQITWQLLNSANEVIDTCSFVLTVENPTSIDILNGVKVYPNPTNGVFNVLLPDEEISSVQITDISGKIILSKEAQGKTVLDLSREKSGVYFLQIENAKGVVVKKIIKR